MSGESLVEGQGSVLGAWDNDGQVFFAPVDRAAAPAPAPGTAAGRKYPSLARNAAGETLFAWTEGAGWQRRGALAWQLYDRAGKPTAEAGHLEDAIPIWGLPAA